jgi:pimeloyl-ACP methyl ester carboxylesterase
MPFDVDTVDLVEDLLSAKYNVFLFDLRNSGESEGTISGYGYLEWQDVIGAIEHVRKISVTTNVILYGVGSGCAASLLAIDKLPDPAEYGRTYSKKIENLAFDRSYVAGVILDSPAKDTDDYIRPLVRESGGLGMITQYTVPYAIRMSAGESSSLDLSAKISQLPIPVVFCTEIKIRLSAPEGSRRSSRSVSVFIRTQHLPMFLGSRLRRFL